MEEYANFRQTRAHLPSNPDSFESRDEMIIYQFENELVILHWTDMGLQIPAEPEPNVQQSYIRIPTFSPMYHVILSGGTLEDIRMAIHN